MGKVPFMDVMEAELFALRSRVSDPDELRITPLRYGRVPGVTAADVPGWAEFIAEPSRRALSRQVGVVAIGKDRLFAERDGMPGVARAIGRAVVFAPWPKHVLLDFADESFGEPDVRFGVQMDQPVVRITPAVLAPSGTLCVPDTGFSPAGPIDVDAVPLRMRVY